MKAVQTVQITDKTGVVRAIPVKPSRYEEYGFPMPSVNNLTKETKDLAKELAAKGERDKLAILYVREEPLVQKHTMVKKIKGEDVKVPYLKAVRGNPIGVLVGFKTKDGTKIGWSKRNASLDENDLPLEKLFFTKKDALEVALMRGLVDTITISPSGRSAKVSDGAHIPKCIEKALPHFIKRVVRCFNDSPANVFQS